MRLAAAALLSEMAAVVRTFGDLIRDEIEEPGAPDEAELTAALDALRHHRAQVEALLLDDPRSRMGLWEFNSVLLTVTDRMLAELDVVEHARVRGELGDAGGPGCARPPRWNGCGTRPSDASARTSTDEEP